MRLVTQWIGFSLFSTFGAHMSMVADPVVLENSAGESYLTEISLDSSFHDVMKQLNYSLSLVENHSQNAERKRIDPAGVQVIVQDNTVVAKAVASPRNYHIPLSASEAADLAYIITTLANRNLIMIKASEKDLKTAGNRIDHIHPLNFLSGIFTNQELIACMSVLRERSWVWKGYLKGLSTSMEEEMARNNVLQFVQDFANRVHVDASLLIPPIKAGKWEKLVDILIKNVPRDQRSGSYNL